MASTQIGIVKLADGTITQVINPQTDAALDTVALKAGETLLKLNRSAYQTTVGGMTVLAAAQGLKTK